MKKVKMISFALVFALLIGIVMPVQKVEAASKIDFGGKYNHTKWGLYLKMHEYIYPEGKTKGNFRLEPSAHVYLAVEGTLKKIGKNKYQCKKGKSVFTFKVYKKKVVVSMNKRAVKDYFDYRGTYKLKKRYDF